MSDILESGEIINPGRVLYDLLCNIVPHDNSTPVLAEIDAIFKDNGRFSTLSYESAIGYAFRRLLTYAIFMSRREKTQGENELLDYLRGYLTSETNFPNEYHEKICILLVECIKAREKRVSNSMRKEMLQPVQTNGALCYICGCELTLSEGQRNTAIIEHIWPRAMGGSSTKDNLSISCMDCSEKKNDYVNYFDYHYEKISMISHIEEKNFNSDFNSTYRIAVWTKNLFKCGLCGKPSTEVGKLDFSRINSNDHWHFLNIITKCCNH
jgi:hypothetical protein